MALNNEIRSKLTEHHNNYKLCNLNLMSCYGGLYPATLTKLSLVIFNQILSNKMYYKSDSKFYDPQEEKRIYTNIPVTPVTLLQNCHPVKYRLNEGDTNKDVGNMAKRINELDDNNIFYVWKCGYPKNYMFILERDIGLWKFYNPIGYVTPKTIKKIITSTKGMCNSMFKIIEATGDNQSIHDVRKFFCEFVNRIAGKMHPEIFNKLEKWDEGRGYKEYLISLNKQINEFSLYEGLEEDKTFYDRLPLDVQIKIFPKQKEIDSHEELESSLLPKENNLAKPKKRKRIPTTDKEAKFDTFKSVDPMKNSNDFIRFYRSVVTLKCPGAQFHDYKFEFVNSSLILDMLKNDEHNEDFLRSWILFYVETKLKGNNSKQKDKTSLKSFKDTYEEYNTRYIGYEVQKC